MAIDDVNVGPQKFEPFSPPEEPPAKTGRGCFFWGCLISSILMLLIVIAIGVSAWLGLRWVKQIMMEYSEPAPMAMPEVAMSDDQKEAVYKRWDDFQAALEQDQAATIELTSDELNALLSRNEEIRGIIHAQIVGDELEGFISFPFEKLGNIPMMGSLKGRYFNAKGGFKVSLNGGALNVQMTSAEVKGKPVPAQIMDEMSQQNLAKDAYNNPEHAKVLRKFSTIEVKDGKMILKANGAGGVSADASSTDSTEATKVEPAEPTSESEPAAEPAAPAEEVPAAEPKPEEAPAPTAEPAPAPEEAAKPQAA
jgi:hypothetical protein